MFSKVEEIQQLIAKHQTVLDQFDDDAGVCLENYQALTVDFNTAFNMSCFSEIHFISCFVQ